VLRLALLLRVVHRRRLQAQQRQRLVARAMAGLNLAR